MRPSDTQPKRRKRYASILYDTLAILGVGIVALDQAKVLDFSPNAERFLRGAAAVLGAILVSDKIDMFRDRQRQRRKRRNG